MIQTEGEREGAKFPRKSCYHKLSPAACAAGLAQQSDVTRHFNGAPEAEIGLCALRLVGRSAYQDVCG